jgi:hypothetical protein
LHGTTQRGDPVQPTPPSPSPARLYFINAPVDFLLIGAASILTFLVFLGLQWYGVLPWDSRPLQVTQAALVLTWLCNWPHFSASSYRLYHSRDNIRQYPVTALVIPWVVLAGVVASFASPALIAPYFVKLFRIWSPYHFSGQTLGISLIYARRSGWKVSPWQRFTLSSFIYGTFLVGTIRAETATTLPDFFGIADHGMGLPLWLAQLAELWMYGAGGAFLVLAAFWCIRNRRPLPAIMVLPAVTQFVWFGLAHFSLPFAEFVPFFHSLQYLLIAWSVQLKEKKDLQQLKPSWHYVVGESLRWGALNLGGGAGLFYLLPRLASEVGGFPLLFATGVISCGVQIHHFFVDGVIWKLKNKSVSSPLMVNIEDLVGRAPQPEGAAA